MKTNTFYSIDLWHHNVLFLKCMFHLFISYCNIAIQINFISLYISNLSNEVKITKRTTENHKLDLDMVLRQNELFICFQYCVFSDMRLCSLLYTVISVANLFPIWSSDFVWSNHHKYLYNTLINQHTQTSMNTVV